MPTDKPDAEMMAPVDKLARFIEGGAVGVPDGIFADKDVVIVENFAPFLFTGPDALDDWAAGMHAHLEGVTELGHGFGEACDFSRSGDTAYFSLPTAWRGINRGEPFAESGGWALVLTKESGVWRLLAYGWAVIETTCKM
jgi:hypothetical protein